MARAVNSSRVFTGFRVLVLPLVALLLVSGLAHARTVYIDDTLYAPVRSGQGTQFRILHNGLRSGTAVTLLEQSGDSGYSKIRTSQGIEGWVPTRYLTNQPIARDRLDAANSELEQARNELEELQNRMSEVSGERDQLSSREQQLQNRVDELSNELEEIRSVSANALNLDRRNRELQESNQRLKNEVEVLTAEVERLEARKESDFMLLGAGLLILGMFIAVVLPWLKPSKKNDTWA
ncbi:TIGR04211 family SH3 domain-containing protein [Marinobacter bryozoorum]|uniref:TIGR04211 family SH3 domain-containing protein n=1 Tax=Marinobacter bryozoorum TaxID=256324 RepID=UPI002002C109|nr:TIGR04211 family SH3 domain-containing protein [Marinobacter bryozoorum]MCK7543212.1 TIGR04211 family SH3 domain-containing protein [Marinobacter bryozoorum]